jgi:hypothetical protein
MKFECCFKKEGYGEKWSEVPMDQVQSVFKQQLPNPVFAMQQLLRGDVVRTRSARYRKQKVQPVKRGRRFI